MCAHACMHVSVLVCVCVVCVCVRLCIVCMSARVCVGGWGWVGVGVYAALEAWQVSILCLPCIGGNDYCTVNTHTVVCAAVYTGMWAHVYRSQEKFLFPNQIHNLELVLW